MKKYHDVLPKNTAFLENKDKKIKTLIEYKTMISHLSQRLEQAMEQLEKISLRLHLYQNKSYSKDDLIQYYLAKSTTFREKNTINSRSEEQQMRNLIKKYSDKLH